MSLVIHSCPENGTSDNVVSFIKYNERPVSLTLLVVFPVPFILNYVGDKRNLMASFN